MKFIDELVSKLFQKEITVMIVLRGYSYLSSSFSFFASNGMSNHKCDRHTVAAANK